jgi:hypothetical protein
MLDPSTYVLAGRRGLPGAQGELMGAARLLGYFSIGWYGTSVSDEIGSFALANPDGPLVDYVGEVLQVTLQHRTVYVYLLGTSREIESDIALTRRAFLEISLLPLDPIGALVAVVK